MAVDRDEVLGSASTLSRLQNRHYQNFVNRKPEGRYLQLLEDTGDILNQVPKQIIASYIGITPTSFSRLKKRLEEDATRDTPNPN